MEIEVGDYIRDNHGIIAKVKKKEVNIIDTIINTGEAKVYLEEEIIKHSKNIIDLVEPDDFVNGCLIEKFYDENEEEYLGVSIYDDACMDCIIEVLPLKRMCINEILTHEQYEDKVFRIKKEKIKNGN